MSRCVRSRKVAVPQRIADKFLSRPGRPPPRPCVRQVFLEEERERLWREREEDAAADGVTAATSRSLTSSSGHGAMVLMLVPIPRGAAAGLRCGSRSEATCVQSKTSGATLVDPKVRSSQQHLPHEARPSLFDQPR